MRLPLSWLAEAAGLADGPDPADVARRQCRKQPCEVGRGDAHPYFPGTD